MDVVTDTLTCRDVSVSDAELKVGAWRWAPPRRAAVTWKVQTRAWIHRTFESGTWGEFKWRTRRLGVWYSGKYLPLDFPSFCAVIDSYPAHRDFLLPFYGLNSFELSCCHGDGLEASICPEDNSSLTRRRPHKPQLSILKRWRSTNGSFL